LAAKVSNHKSSQSGTKDLEELDVGIYNPDFVNWFHDDRKGFEPLDTKVFQWIGFFNCFHANAKKKRSDRKDLASERAKYDSPG
jgi:hypothetical protein